MSGLHIQANHQIEHTEKIPSVSYNKTNSSVLNQSDIRKIQKQLNVAFLDFLQTGSFKKIKKQFELVIHQHNHEQFKALLNEIKLKPDTKGLIFSEEKIPDSERNLKHFKEFIKNIDDLFHSLLIAASENKKEEIEKILKETKALKRKLTQEIFDVTDMKPDYRDKLSKKKEVLNKTFKNIKDVQDMQRKNLSHSYTKESEKFNQHLLNNKNLNKLENNDPNVILPIDIEYKKALNMFMNEISSGTDIFILCRLYFNLQSIYFRAQGAHLAVKQTNQLIKTNKLKDYINQVEGIYNKLDPGKPNDTTQFRTDLAMKIDKLIKLHLLLPNNKYGGVFDLISQNSLSKDGKGYMCKVIDFKAIISALKSEKDKSAQMDTQYTTDITRCAGFANDALIGLKSSLDKWSSIEQYIIKNT